MFGIDDFSLTLPSLRKLTLLCFQNVNFVTLNGIFLRHKGTLQSVEVRCISKLRSEAGDNSGVHWPELLDTLRDLRLQIACFEMEDILIEYHSLADDSIDPSTEADLIADLEKSAEEHEDNIYAYVLNKIDENPLRRQSRYDRLGEEYFLRALW